MLGPHRDLEEASAAGEHGRWHWRSHSMYSESEWGCQRVLSTICSRSEGTHISVCVPGGDGECSPQDPGRCWLHSSPSRTC